MNLFKKNLLFILLLSLVIPIFSGCSENNTVDIKYRRPAVLHSDKAEYAMNKIENDRADELEIYAAQAFIYDINEGKYLFLRGADKILYPASTTKLLTALYALTLLDADELVTPGEEQKLKDPQSAVAFVRSNHTLTVEMLVQAMMLPSGGDAAYALAAAGGKVLCGNDCDAVTAINAFIEGMNEHAKELGLCGSNFASPDGFYDPQNYSTIEDMTILALRAMENETIMKYASMPQASVTYASGHTNTWKNTNRMIHEGDKYYSPYVTGLKTGTLEGNSCLLCSFEIKGKKYAAGVFSEKSEELRYEDMTKIIKFCEKESK